MISLGQSHVSVLSVPYNVFISIENKRRLSIFSGAKRSGADFALAVARLRKPDQYTGKGLLPLFRALTLKKKTSK